MFLDSNSMFDSLISPVSLQSTEEIAEFYLGLVSDKYIMIYCLGVGINDIGYSNLFLP